MTNKVNHKASVKHEPQNLGKELLLSTIGVLAVGVFAGATLPKQVKWPVKIVAAIVFLGSYLMLIPSLFAKAFSSKAQ